MKKKSRFIVLPLLAIVSAAVLVMAVSMGAMQDKPTGARSVDRGSAYVDPADDEYDFVESEGNNGVRYYVIPENGSTTKASQMPGDGSATTSDINMSYLTEATRAPVVTTAASPSSSAQTTTTRENTSRSTTASTTVSSTASVEASSATSQAVSSTTSSTTASATTTTTKKKSNQKVVYLTFDDGPSINTIKILDILDKYNVKATFFVIYHKNMESRYKAIVERGHTIALHSYTHSYKSIYSSTEGYFSDLKKIHDYIQKVTGVDSRIMRFPGGSSNTVSNKYNKGIMKTLKQEVTDRGYIYHDWNVDSTDASGRNRAPELLIENVKKGLGKRRVANILMHDTGKSKMTTVEALPEIIEYIQSQGYTFEPLTEDSEVIQHKR